MPTTFRGLLALSVLVTLTNLLVPVMAGPSLVAIPLVVIPLAGWLWLLTFALMTYGKRGSWLLIELPLILFWPLALVGYVLRGIPYPFDL
jgi:hypothetical protein